MKRITSLLFLFVFAVSLTACSEDNDDIAEESTSSDLVGTWDMTKNESDNAQIKINTEYQMISIAQQYYSENIDYQIVFKKNETVTSGGSFDQVTTTQINKKPRGTSTLSVDNGADGQGFFAGNYDVKGGFVIIEDIQNNTTQTAKIISLDKGKMVLELDLSQAKMIYTVVNNLSPSISNVEVKGTSIVELQKRK